MTRTFTSLALPFVLPLALACSSSDSKSPATDTSGGTGGAKNEAPAPKGTWTSLGYDLSSTYFNPKETRLTKDNVPSLGVAWEKSLAGGVQGAPAIVDGTAFVLSSGALYALEVATGKIIWTNEDIGGTSSPTFENGIVYVSGSDINGETKGALVYAVDAKDGKEKWHASINENPMASGFSSPVVTDKYVVLGDSSFEESSATENATFRGAVVAFDKGTGKEVWRFHTVEEPYNGCAVWATVSVDTATNTVFAPTGNNYTEDAGPTSDSVFALDLDSGKQKWMLQASENDVYTISNPRSPDSDFGTNPILFEAKIDGTARKLVGMGQKSGVFWAIDRETGKVVWKRDFGNPSSVGGILNNGAYDGEHIIVASNGASSDAPGGDVSNGKTPAIFQVAPVATVFALDPASGDIVWERQVGAYVWAPITIANGVGFVAVEDELEAFDTKTGAKLPFSFDAGGTITSAPVVVDGRVFFGSGMTLVVFGKPDPDNKFHVLTL